MSDTQEMPVSQSYRSPERSRPDRERRHGDLNVLVLTGHPEGTAPGQRFRFEQHIGTLGEQGIHLHISSFLPAGIMPTLHRSGSYGAKMHAVLSGVARRVRDLRSSRNYDVALVHKEAAPLGYPLVERLLPTIGIPYVFDFDDAVYLRHASEANRLVAPLKFAGKTGIIARHADLVVPGNVHLADWASRYSDRVRVIPTTIDTDVYRPSARSGQADRPICIGWTGSVTTARYLDALAPVLADLQRQAGVRLKVIGDPGYRIPGAVVEAAEWRAATEVSDLGEIDIGIMPLPDDEWARGKCGLKALQYMALEIPTVMSPVGVNAAIARDDAARLAGSPDEWRSVLGELIADPGVRADLGRRGRERVEREYSASVAAPLWAEAFTSVADARKDGHRGR